MQVSVPCGTAAIKNIRSSGITMRLLQRNNCVVSVSLRRFEWTGISKSCRLAPARFLISSVPIVALRGKQQGVLDGTIGCATLAEMQPLLRAFIVYVAAVNCIAIGAFASSYVLRRAKMCLLEMEVRGIGRDHDSASNRKRS